MTTVKQLTTPELTSSNFLPSAPTATGADVLVRVVTDSSASSFEVRWANTLEVTDPIRKAIQAKDSDIGILVNVVKWQHRLLDYNSHYNAYLLDQTTEEEFETIAESFSYEPTDIAPELLAPLVRQIYQLTEIPYTPSELAGFFHCNHLNVMEAVLQIAPDTPIVSDMLPTLQHTEVAE